MPLQAGDKAPEFNLLNQNNEMINLKKYAGNWLLLYFYPRDNTPGCTVEAKDFTCMLQEFSNLNVSIVGISKDSVESHQKFIARQELAIELLSDPEMETINAYDVWKEKKMYGKTRMGIVRSTFLIDPKGIICIAWHNVRAKGHAERVYKEIKKFL